MHITWGEPTEEEAQTVQRLSAASDATRGIDGELLAFRNATVARVEVNKNHDEIDEDGLRELAASIQYNPLDDEHLDRKIVGFFLGGEVVEKALVTHGILFAKRFPQEAAAVMAGVKHLSIEADVAQAVCSICGGAFTRRRDYCAHLQDVRASGAVRKLRGLKAVGAGIVLNPAGTDTTFDRSMESLEFMASEDADEGTLTVRLIASMMDDEEETEGEPATPPPCEDDEDEAEAGCGDKKDETKAAEENEDDVDAAALATAMAEMTAAAARIAELGDQLQAAQNALATAEAATKRERDSRLRGYELLRAGVALDEVEALGEHLADSPEPVIAALIKLAVKAKSDETVRASAAKKPASAQIVIGDSPDPFVTSTMPRTSWGHAFGN